MSKPTTLEDVKNTIQRGLCCIAEKLDAQASSPQIDIENTGWLCKDDTWQHEVVVYTDGVETSRTAVDSGITCSDDPPAATPLPPQVDFEEYCNVDTGTLWRRTILYTWVDPLIPTAVTTTEINHADTFVSCDTVETPDGEITSGTFSFPLPLVRSFAVKGLAGATFDISFNAGATWQTEIDGADSWGEGNRDNENVVNVRIKPSFPAQRVFIHWET